VFDWNKSKNEKAALDIAKELVQTEKETFENTISIQLNEVQSEIEKLTLAIQSDNEIIQLREKVLKASDSQLKNGAITSSDYLTELTQLFDVKSAQKMHEIQLHLAQLNYQIIKGN
jgi:outer membrane protein TolC